MCLLEMIKKLFHKLFPVERLVLLVALFTWLLYKLFDISLRRPGYFYFREILSSLDIYVLALLGAFLFTGFSLYRSGKFSLRTTWQDFSLNYLSIKSISHDLRLFNALILILVIFTQLKHLIPLINSQLHDSWCIELERSLFGGKLAGEVLWNIFGLGSAPFFSVCYLLFYPYVTVLVTLMIMQRDRRLSQRFAYNFSILWVLGILLVYIFPTRGPAFILPVFQRLPQTDVSILQQELAVNAHFLLSNPRSDTGLFLISGFPSLHFWIVLFGSVYLQRLNRTVAALSWIFLALTVLSTLYFGWHYLIDLLPIPIA